MVNEQFGMQQDGPMNSIEQQVLNQQNISNESNNSSKDGQPEYAQIAGIISDLDRRLRTLEERYSNLRKKLQLTDENLLDAERTFSREIKSFNEESLELKRHVNEFSEKIGMLSSEMDNIAKKPDLKVVEKYLDMWNPINFVTRRELKEFLKAKGLLMSSRNTDEENSEE